MTYSSGLLGNWKLCAYIPQERPLADPLTEHNKVWLVFPFSLNPLTHSLTHSLTHLLILRKIGVSKRSVASDYVAIPIFVVDVV